MSSGARPRPQDIAARLTNVDLNLLPALLALLQERSVTGAAQRLGLSQPAMSHTLARLRTLLGDDLLVRVGRAYMLTPRASALQSPVQEVLNRLSEGVLQAPGFSAGTDVRHFTLSMTPSTALVVSPSLLELIVEQASAVSFEVVDSPAPGLDLFAQPEIDLALLADSVTTPYERQSLYVDRWVGVVWEGNSLVRSSLSVEHLARLVHVAYRSPAVRTSPYVVLAAAGVQPRFDLVSSNFLLIPMLIVGTQRIAIVQERLARKIAAGFALRVLDLPLSVPPLGIDLVANPRLAGDAGTAWLIQALRQRV